MDKDGCSYVVSLQKPTVVQFAVVGNFRNPNELDIMLARVNRIEHLLVTSEGLKPHKEIPIFGRIASMNLYRLPGEKLDSLLVLTAKYHLAILGFEPDGTPKTRAYGHVADKVGRPAETGIISCVHESGDLNGRHLKVCEVDLEAHELKAALWHQSNIEAEATLLVPIPAPYGGLVVVGQESISYQKSPSHFVAVAPPLINMARFNCYGRIDRTGERFLLGDMSGRLFMLLLLRGADTDEIRDLKIELLGEISIPECLVYLDNSVAFIGSRLGDSQLIRLSTEPVDSVSNSFVIVIDTFPNLGPIRDLVLIDVDGQKQLVCASGAYKDGSLRVIRSGIGIDEMATVELAGIKAIFTLRINSDLDNYLVLSFADVTHLLLIDQEELEDTQIQDFELSKPTLWAGNILSSNKILQITPDSVQLISIVDNQFKTKHWKPPNKISLASVNSKSGQFVVVSGNKLFYLIIKLDEIVFLEHLECINEISCVDISPLSNSINSNLIAFGFWAEHSVAVYAIHEKGLQKLTEEKLSNEFLPKSLLLITMESLHYLFVALGDGTVIHFRINPENGLLFDQKKFSLGTQPTTLMKFISKKLAVNVFVCSDRPTVIYSSNNKLSFSNVNLRSVNQMCPLNSEHYRGCLALTDGENLLIGTIDDIQKLHIRNVPLGESVSRLVYQPETKLIAILTYRPEEYVGCNGVIQNNKHNYSRPSISVMGAKYASAQHPQQQQQPQFSESSTPSSSNKQSQCQQIEPTNVDSCCAPASTSSTAVAPTAVIAPHSDTEMEVYSVCFLDSNTFECLNVLELNKQEVGISICSAHLGEDPNPYFAIGTAIVVPDEQEPKQAIGRILIVQATQNTDSADGLGSKLRIVTEKEVKGAVYSITTLGNKLICTVNSTVRLFEWTPERELRLECSNFNYIQALYLKTKGDLVLIGDLMRSICLLSYKPTDSSFEEIARDYSAEWTTSCEIVDSETFFAAETNFNIYCCKIDVNAETDEDRMRLKAKNFQQIGLFYLGELVNVFYRGTIISNQQRDSRKALFTNPIIYGAADGGLGAIVQVEPHIYFMRVDHPSYRSFFSERRTEAASGFIDGDLIETVVEMPRDMLADVCEGLKMRRPDGTLGDSQPLKPEDILKLVEDLAQIQ
uniref:DNA damage-binding protein 1 n=1 Tax=Meloidogyne hapla TaxID=6305 RepID=A0A1I8C0G3_MELHA